MKFIGGSYEIDGGGYEMDTAGSYEIYRGGPLKLIGGVWD